MSLVADTTVLIDLWRLRKQPHRLDDLKKKLIDPFLPLPVVYEFARGAAWRGVTREKLGRFLAGFGILFPVYEEILEAAELEASLRREGREIGASDVWIATAALNRDWPVLTANLSHFSRIEGLKLVGYQINP